MLPSPRFGLWWSGFPSGSRSCSVAQGIDQERECRRGLAAARIVEVVSRKRWAPVREHALKLSRCYMGLDVIVRQVRDPCAVEGAKSRERDIVDDQLPFDANVEGAAGLLELPGVQAAKGREAKVDATVLRQILRRSGG